MPCYTVQTMSVEFKAKHRKLLEKTLNDLRMPYREYEGNFYLDNGIFLNLQTGQATIAASQQQVLNQIKRKYAQNAVYMAARQHGWAVRATQQNAGIIQKGVR